MMFAIDCNSLGALQKSYSKLIIYTSLYVKNINLGSSHPFGCKGVRTKSQKEVQTSTFVQV